MERGWEKPAQICITHEFMIQDIRKAGGPMDVSEEDYWFIEEFLQNVRYDDYDCLVQLCDALALPTGFCILEKRVRGCGTAVWDLSCHVGTVEKGTGDKRDV